MSMPQPNTLRQCSHSYRLDPRKTVEGSAIDNRTIGGNLQCLAVAQGQTHQTRGALPRELDQASRRH